MEDVYLPLLTTVKPLTQVELAVKLVSMDSLPLLKTHVSNVLILIQLY